MFGSVGFLLLFTYTYDVNCELKNLQMTKLLSKTEFNIHPAQIHLDLLVNKLNLKVCKTWQIIDDLL